MYCVIISTTTCITLDVLLADTEYTLGFAWRHNMYLNWSVDKSR